MVIKNESDVRVFIHGNAIEPGGSYECTEHVFDTVYVNSDIGSVVITTEYNIRSFRGFGELIGQETDGEDAQGLRNIAIRRKSWQ